LSRRLDRAERDWADDLNRVRVEHTSDIQRLEREHTEDLRKLRGDVIRPLDIRIGVLEKARGMTFGRWIGVLGVVAAFAAVVVTAWAASKGAHS
jgi:hypothetical protein